MRGRFKNAALVGLLVKKLEEKCADKQIGKTKIQKLMYLLGEELKEDLGYAMYHYGPYSIEIDEGLTLANIIGWLNVKWDVDRGYFISTKNLPYRLQITDKEEKAIEYIVSKYGSFSALELSIIATAIYVRENFGVKNPDELIDIVLDLKPNNQRDWIKSILQKSGVINESN